MKKPIILLLVAMAALVACKNQKAREKTILGDFTPWEDYPEQLKGEIKEVKELNYWAVEKDGVIDKGALITRKERDSIGWTDDFVALFNEAGQITKADYLDDHSLVKGSWAVKIDSGKLRSAEYTFKDTVRNLAKFILNEKGNITEVLMHKPGNDSLQGRYVATCDQNGDRLDMQWIKVTGEKGNHTSYAWDANHHVTEIRYYNAKDSLTGSMTQTYNGQGLMATQKVFDGKQVLTNDLSITNKDFDEKGNYLQSITYKNGKPQVVTVRTYTYY